MQSLIRKIKKAPKYAFSILSTIGIKEFLTIYKHVERQDLRAALHARTHRHPFVVNLKNGLGKHELNTFLEHLQYRKRHVVDQLYLWKYNGKSCYATYNQFLGLHLEYLADNFKGMYAYDWQDKVVIDIGGFVGDSALFFLEQGAREVIIYEPLSVNIQALNYNLRPYQGRFAVHQAAIDKQEGWMLISSSSPEGNPGFGMEQGEYEIRCRATTFQQVLSHTPHADVIKIDGEGCEAYLVDLPNAKIQSIPYWIVETHRKDLYDIILKKFEECGFRKIKDFSLTPAVNLLHFEYR